MLDDFPRLTIFIGPQSAHGLAVNLAVRDNRPAMIQSGLIANPTRIASPALRSLADDGQTLDERRAAFTSFSADGPAFFAALNFLGAPHRGFRRSELFPEAEIHLGALAEVAGDRTFRMILAPDALPDLFLAAGSDVLEDRVTETPWEQLYELSWADLVEGLLDCLPKVELLVLTHAGLALGGHSLAERLFGPGAEAMDPRVFLRETLNVTGQAVLDRMGSGLPPETAARELYQSFAERADVETCRTRLGMDRLTRKLLHQRFDEDIGRIAAMDRVEVI